MRIALIDMKVKYDQHRTLVYAHASNVFMRLLRLKPVLVRFIGHGTVWETWPEYGPVHQSIRIKLMQAEKRWRFILRTNPRAKFPDYAKEVNKQINL